MGLDDLTTDKIIAVIKNKNAPYQYGGYVYFNKTKLSPIQIFKSFKQTEKFSTTNSSHNKNKNIYTKLLSILSELNNESIYLKLPDKYKGDILEPYHSQLKYLPKTEQSNSEEIPMKQ